MVKGNNDYPPNLSPGNYSTLKSKNCAKSGDIRIGLVLGICSWEMAFRKRFKMQT